eukprot:2174077-Pyramimonas_sp.AAC.1
MQQVIDFAKRHLDRCHARQVVDVPCAVDRDRLKVIILLKHLLMAQVDRAAEHWEPVPHYAADTCDSTSGSSSAATETALAARSW